MGLDITELFMALEDEFGIELDDEANEIVTAGDLYDYVMARIGPRVEAGGSEDVRVCAVLGDHCGVDPATLKPDTQLEALFPRRGRRGKWKAVNEALGWCLPELVRSGWVVLLAFLGYFPFAVLTTSFVLAMGFAPGIDGSWSPLVALLWLLLSPWIYGPLAVAATRRLANRFPFRFETLANVVAASNRRLMIGRRPAFLRFREALARHVGVAEDRITSASRLDILIPRRGMMGVWPKIGKELGVKLPQFEDLSWFLIPTGFLFLLWFGEAGFVVWYTVQVAVPSLAEGGGLGPLGAAALLATVPVLHFLMMRQILGMISSPFTSCHTVGWAVEALKYEPTRQDLFDGQTSRTDAKGRCNTFCLNPTAFFRLRRAMREILGIGSRDVKLTSVLEGLFARERRRAEWGTLQDKLNLSLPPLVRSSRLTCFLRTFALLAALAGWGVAYMVWQSPLWSWGSAFTVGVLLVVYGTLAYHLSKPWAVFFPETCQTVQGAVQELVCMNHGKLLAEREGSWGDMPDSREVWETVKRMIAEKAEASLDEVTRDARLINDLGMG